MLGRPAGSPGYHGTQRSMGRDENPATITVSSPDSCPPSRLIFTHYNRPRYRFRHFEYEWTRHSPSPFFTHRF